MELPILPLLPKGLPFSNALVNSTVISLIFNYFFNQAVNKSSTWNSVFVEGSGKGRLHGSAFDSGHDARVLR